MGEIGKIFAGIGLLIAIFLFLNNAQATTNIISSFASNTTAGIRALQGK